MQLPCHVRTAAASSLSTWRVAWCRRPQSTRCLLPNLLPPGVGSLARQARVPCLPGAPRPVRRRRDGQVLGGTALGVPGAGHPQRRSSRRRPCARCRSTRRGGSSCAAQPGERWLGLPRVAQSDEYGFVVAQQRHLSSAALSLLATTIAMREVSTMTSVGLLQASKRQFCQRQCLPRNLSMAAENAANPAHPMHMPLGPVP